MARSKDLESAHLEGSMVHCCARGIQSHDTVWDHGLCQKPVLSRFSCARYFDTIAHRLKRFLLRLLADKGLVDAAYGGDIPRELTLTRFDRFNFTSNRYTGPPSESVDQAWDDLGIWGPSLLLLDIHRQRADLCFLEPFFILPKHLGPTFGLNNSHYWHPRETMGVEGYPVVPEMIHHLHCLVGVELARSCVKPNSFPAEFPPQKPVLQPRILRRKEKRSRRKGPRVISAIPY